MDILKKKIHDFKPIEMPDIAKEDGYFDLLYGVLKKINKTGQKSSNTISAMKDEIVEEVQKTYQTVEEMREERIRVIRDNERLEKGVIELNDIVENLGRAAEVTKIPELAEMITIASKAVDQINAKLGIIKVPAEPHTKIDDEYHIKINTEVSQNKANEGKISGVVEQGYRRGDKVLRRASVIVFKFEGIENE
jgi:molecular chaperone GrpE (heat shock protein)